MFGSRLCSIWQRDDDFLARFGAAVFPDPLIAEQGRTGRVVSPEQPSRGRRKSNDVRILKRGMSRPAAATKRDLWVSGKIMARDSKDAVK